MKEVEDIVSDVVSKAPAKKPAKPKIHNDVKKLGVASTVKGGKLPKTAGNYLANIMAGLTLVLIGIALHRRFKVAGI
ncbi:hypothetical protein [Planomicrobium sp. CPCC 101110]|uniref:hypothetical protein n=1 Tax=Planomicrobium sp. CPCC 101110 TaxID=2599619 RepID=UPI0011B35CBA|nr:hypothetical protein [Planomicrobium sp. CPCC 101110]TWT27865.1 hypothetical protein FQV30_04995 [Planomicrobium sp. CPCC 101110]